MTKAVLLKDMIGESNLNDVSRTLIDAAWHIEYAVQLLRLSGQMLARKVYGGDEHNTSS